MVKANSDPDEPITLYHFTNLFNLPEILSEGLILGEIPVETLAYSERPHAPNLTRNPDPVSQLHWASGVACDKTRVRLTVTMPKMSFTTFKTIRQRYSFRSRWVKLLAPADQHFDWYFALGGVRPECIDLVDVALTRPFEHSNLSGEKLRSLVRAIEDERERLAMRRNGPAIQFTLPDNFSGTFLFDGEAALRQEEYPIAPMATDLRSMLLSYPSNDEGMQLLDSNGLSIVS